MSLVHALPETAIGNHWSSAGVWIISPFDHPERKHAMAKDHKGDSAPRVDQSGKGEHGGNRAGDADADKKPDKSSQAAGKDPHRGKD